MKELNPVLQKEIIKHQKLLEMYDNDYAKDLKSYSQKLRRVKNVAIINAAREYNKQHLLGYSSVLDDIILCEDRANHYGRKVGSVVGKIYIKGKDYTSLLCETILEFRKQVKQYDSSHRN